MTFEVEAGGKRRTIVVQRAHAGWNVTVDGRSMSADLARVEDRWSLLVSASGEGTVQRSYDVVVESRGRDGQVVHIDGRAIPVAMRDPRRRVRRGRGPVDAFGPGPREVVAPMPGRIVRVLVRPGETVAAQQGLVVVEAMKMENELRAPRAGTVARVLVTEGMSVEANAVLLVVD